MPVENEYYLDPNPAENDVFIGHNVKQCVIYDTNGRVVSHLQNINGYLNISNLKSEKYFIHMTFANNKSITKILIKK